jgi:hypothetical protein
VGGKCWSMKTTMKTVAVVMTMVATALIEGCGFLFEELQGKEEKCPIF